MTQQQEKKSVNFYVIFDWFWLPESTVWSKFGPKLDRIRYTNINLTFKEVTKSISQFHHIRLLMSHLVTKSSTMYCYIGAKDKFRISTIFQCHLWTPHIQLSQHLPYIPMNIGPISKLILPLLLLCSKEMERIFTTSLTFCLLLQHHFLKTQEKFPFVSFYLQKSLYF